MNTNGPRQTGRTLAMVRELPPHAHVIVTTEPLKKYVLQMIRDVRGYEFSRGIHVWIVRDRKDVAPLFGVNSPIRCDHAFEDYADPGVLAMVKRIADEVDQRAGARP